MKKLLTVLGAVAIVFLGSWGFSGATSTLITQQGGTGSTTPSGILYGDNGLTSHLNTVGIGSGLTFSGGTLSATGGGGSGNVSTSTTETKGYLSYWTTTGATPARLGKVATSSITFSGPFTSSGTLGALVGGTNYTLTLPQANGSTNGYLSSTDWTTFNGKISSVVSDYPLQGSGTSASHLSLAFGTTTANTWALTQTFTSVANFNKLTNNGNATTTSLALTGINGAAIFNGSTKPASQYAGVTCTNQVLTGLNASIAGTCSTVSNAMLANSTISGIALGSNLANLSATDSTLTFSGTYNGSTARTIGLNLGNANSWTAKQTFTFASTTQIGSTGNAYFATSGGNVGIGTTTPSKPLSVGGNVLIGAATAGGTLGTLTVGGKTTLGNASTTRLTITGGALYFPTVHRTPYITSGDIDAAHTQLYFVGANSGYVFDAGLYPSSDGGASLGGTVSGVNYRWANLNISGNASTTQISAASQKFYVNSAGRITGYDTTFSVSGALSPMRYLAIKLATTTTWTGTTSEPYTADFEAPWTGFMRTIACYTSAGTLTVKLTNGATSKYLKGASTTNNTNVFASALAITRGDKLTLDAGNPASSPTWVSCTLGATETP